jgi:hypothetical protein
MKRLHAGRPRIRRGRLWPEDLPADPRDPDVVRAKVLARARLTGSSRTSRAYRGEHDASGHDRTARTPA